MSDRTTAVLADVAGERRRQTAKHGAQAHLPDGTGAAGDRAAADAARALTDAASQRGDVSFRLILDEEVAEAFAETDPVALREELVQVAAVAVQWVEALDERAGRPVAGPPPTLLPTAEKITETLLEAWKKAEPKSPPSQHPVSYVRSFYDMAVAVLELLNGSDEAPAAADEEACPDIDADRYTDRRHQCQRHVSHAGPHQAIDKLLGHTRLMTWTRSGSTGAAVPEQATLTTCTGCGAWVITKDGDEPANCHSCQYWADQIAAGGGVVEDGVHYRIGSGQGQFLGFNGQPWRVTFLDGRVVETNDLTHQGTVPGHLRAQLPDNARIERIEKKAFARRTA